MSEIERSSQRRRGIAEYEAEARDTSISEWWEYWLRAELYTWIPDMTYTVALTADDHSCTLPNTPCPRSRTVRHIGQLGVGWHLHCISTM